MSKKNTEEVKPDKDFITEIKGALQERFRAMHGNYIINDVGAAEILIKVSDAYSNLLEQERRLSRIEQSKTPT